jgi:NitT/TauT family transport system ATP-binding protein
MSALVTLKSVGKNFDNGTKAIEGVDLDIADGEFLSLLGPSGCGKSTTLRIVAGLLRPTVGTVAFPAGRPEIGFVFQDPTLMPWATALANVRLPLDLKGVARSEADGKAGEALRRLGLSGFERAYPRELSGGMKMRVSIARALSSGPKLLLMDEPFAALDELARSQLNDDLLNLWGEDRLTVVFVTHSVFESSFLSSRVLVMTPRPGRIHSEIALPAPLSRDVRFRVTPAFTETTARVSEALRAAMKGGAPLSDHEGGAAQKDAAAGGSPTA